MKKVAAKSAPVPKIAGDLTRQVEKLFEDGVLVDLRIGMWTALKRNTADDLGITHDDVPENVVGLGTNRVLPHDLVKTWTRIAHHARYVVSHDSFLFPLGEVPFVPLRILPRIEEELEQCKTQYEAAWRSGLLGKYDALKKAYIEKYPEHAAGFPSREEIERRFYFEYSAFTVSLPKKIRKQQHDKKKAAAEEAAMLRYQQELETRVQEFLSESVKTLRTKAVDMCAVITDSIKGGKVIHGKSLTALSTFIDRFKELNFIGDQEIESRLSKLQKDILDGRDADDFKSDDALREALVTACDEITKAAGDVTDLSGVTKSYRRRIVLD